MFETLQMYFQYPFVRYALIVGVLIALCSSLLGVTLVLKRFSFIGDGLSHVAFGAMAIASVLNVTNNMLFILPVTVICAIFLLRAGQNTRIKGDAAIAMISVGALAIGYLLMNLFSTSPNISGDVCSTLFGSTSILTLTEGEVWLCAILSVVVVAVFILFYNKIFECADIFKLCFECFIIKKLIYLNADFSILITKERCNTALCSGNEPGRVASDIRIGDLPGTFCYEIV